MLLATGSELALHPPLRHPTTFPLSYLCLPAVNRFSRHSLSWLTFAGTLPNESTMRLLVNLAMRSTLALRSRVAARSRRGPAQQTPERPAGHDRHAARRPRGQLRIPGCRHPDPRRTCGARRAVRNGGGSYPADGAVTRVDPHRATRRSATGSGTTAATCWRRR